WMEQIHPGRHHHHRPSGLDLCELVGYRKKSRSSIRGDIGDLCELKRFVVAVRLNSPLFLYFKAPALGVDPICKFAFRAVSHELDSSSTIE
uniref:Uncharacterized protein n=1 Tax=Setaria italica TaxID=4555 RepID=A0A0Q3VEZ4_SETIT